MTGTDPSLGRHLDDADSDLERGVLRTLYRSGEQRRRRLVVRAGLIVKHSLRGILFSWPLYLLGSAALVLPGAAGTALALLFLPALGVSGWILRQGLRDDSAQLDGLILKPGAVWKILRAGPETG